jgi:hypothetical protein
MHAQGFDWNGLMTRKLPAPIEINTKGPADTSQFDDYGAMFCLEMLLRLKLSPLLQARMKTQTCSAKSAQWSKSTSSCFNGGRASS